MCRTFGSCIRHSFTCFTKCAFYCSGLLRHSVGWRSVIRLTWSDGLKSSSSMKKIMIYILILRKWSNWWICAYVMKHLEFQFIKKPPWFCCVISEQDFRRQGHGVQILALRSYAHYLMYIHRLFINSCVSLCV